MERFLRGETVPEFYSLPMDMEGFDFEGGSWELSELARLLIDQSAHPAKAPQRKDRWNQAKDLVYRGAFRRYVEVVLKDSAMGQKLSQCVRLADQDLGTALGLCALTGGELPPALRDRVVNRNFVVATVAESGEAGGDRARVLVSSEYIQVHGQIHASTAAELKALANELNQLRQALSELGVQYPVEHSVRDPRQLLDALEREPDALISVIKSEFRQRLAHTTNQRLQSVFSGDLRRVNRIDLAALWISLVNAKHNGYLSNESVAEDLRNRAVQVRAADALARGSRYLTSLFFLFNSRFGPLLLTSWLLITLGVPALLLFVHPGFLVALERAQLISAIFFGLFLALIYSPTSLIFHRALRIDLAAATGRLGLRTARQLTPTTLRQMAGQISAAPGTADGRGCSRQLRELNQHIAALSGIISANYTIEPARFRWTNLTMAAQAVLLVFSIFAAHFSLPRSFHLPSLGSRVTYTGPPPIGPLYPDRTDALPLPGQHHRQLIYVYSAGRLQNYYARTNGGKHPMRMFGDVKIEGDISHLSLLGPRTTFLIVGNVSDCQIDSGTGRIKVTGSVIRSNLKGGQIIINELVQQSTVTGQEVRFGGRDTASTITSTGAK